MSMKTTPRWKQHWFDEVPGPTDPKKWWRTPTYWERAAITVGVTPEARLRWLVEYFAAYPDDSANLPPEETPETLATQACYFVGEQGAGFNIPDDLPAKMFQQLAKDISAGLDDLLAGKEWNVLVNHPMRRTLWRHSWPRRGSRPGRFEDIYELRSSYQVKAAPPVAFSMAFQLAAMDLVYSCEAWRLARCARPDCPRLFVRKDKRQAFCTEACSQAVRTARYRKKSNKQ